MKTKLLLSAALIAGLIGVSSSAQAAVHVSFSFPFPRVVVAAPAPVIVAPVVVAAPVVETAPACPGPGYVWVSGYWSGYGATRAWVAGNWHPSPARVIVDAHPYYGHYGHDGWHR
jgi:hypothetical protein